MIRYTTLIGLWIFHVPPPLDPSEDAVLAQLQDCVREKGQPGGCLRKIEHGWRWPPQTWDHSSWNSTHPLKFVIFQTFCREHDLAGVCRHQWMDFAEWSDEGVSIPDHFILFRHIVYCWLVIKCFFVWNCLEVNWVKISPSLTPLEKIQSSRSF